MSYCRWSTPISELTPDVDLSWEKQLSFGSHRKWSHYCIKNNVKFSDAYVYIHVDGKYVCHWNIGEDKWTDTAKEMAEYLLEQRKQGRLVPDSAIQGLLEEEEEDEQLD